MLAVTTLALVVGVVAACVALGVVRATFYRWRNSQTKEPSLSERKSPNRALSADERQHVLDTLNSEEFVDLSPPQVYAHLLEKGEYLCSIRTMYRILRENRMVRERRNQRQHPTYKKPELLADGPNQLWSWDITKLKGPVKWTYYCLYVLLDVFSRQVVGWMIAPNESAELGQDLIKSSIAKHHVEPTSLTIHSDRGSPMTAKSMAFMLADLGVTKSHSRPNVSNDNPFSESLFKTLKYRPEFPERFGSIEDARTHLRHFFSWYNNHHYHSSLGLFTPADVHYGRVEAKVETRQVALDTAYARHPERFVHGAPNVSRPPEKVWINPPKESSAVADDESASPSRTSPPAPTEVALAGLDAELGRAAERTVSVCCPQGQALSNPQCESDSESVSSTAVPVPTHSSSPSVPASPAPHEPAFTRPRVGSWGAGEAGGGEASLMIPQQELRSPPAAHRTTPELAALP